MTHLCCFGFTVHSILPSTTLDFADSSCCNFKLAIIWLQKRWPCNYANNYLCLAKPTWLNDMEQTEAGGSVFQLRCGPSAHTLL